MSQAGEPRKLILRSFLSPGDILTMTAAVESLHRPFPEEYVTDVRTSVPAVWEHNPRITPLDESGPEITVLDLNYPSIHRSNQVSVTFLEGYTEDLGSKLGIPLRLATNRPHLYLSDQERGWLNQIRDSLPQLAGRDVPFWIVDAGVKGDYTAKQWPVEHALVREDGLSQVQVAELLERHKSWVCRRLALLERLSDECREDLRLGLLSPTMARQLTRLPAGNQAEVVAAARREHLTAAEIDLP